MLCCLLYAVLFSRCRLPSVFLFFFFNDTATTEIYTLSLHDALPICLPAPFASPASGPTSGSRWHVHRDCAPARSEEHTSELQSQSNLVCRLLLEKKKKIRQSLMNVRSQNYHHAPAYDRAICRVVEKS